MKKINDEILEEVTGGVQRIVCNPDAGTARIRSGPGLGYSEKATVANGCKVYTTGDVVINDGYAWYQLDAPVDGWIAGSLIGY